MSESEAELKRKLHIIIQAIWVLVPEDRWYEVPVWIRRYCKELSAKPILQD